MPRPATAYTLVIASPGDTETERKALAEVVHAWNATNSTATGIVLLPVSWEIHSTPDVGQRQVIRDADMLVAVFWTRLGAPAEEAESGTIDEIDRFRKGGKDVIVYFSDAPAIPGKSNRKRYERLEDYRARCGRDGSADRYDSVTELREKFDQHLTSVARRLRAEGEKPIVGALAKAAQPPPPEPIVAPPRAVAPPPAPPPPAPSPPAQARPPRPVHLTSIARRLRAEAEKPVVDAKPPIIEPPRAVTPPPAPPPPSSPPPPRPERPVLTPASSGSGGRGDEVVGELRAAGWRGVLVGQDFYAWEGPILTDLPDRDPVQMPNELDPRLKKALDDAGALASWQSKQNPLTFRDEHRLFITDRKTFKRAISCGTDNVLFVRPAE